MKKTIQINLAGTVFHIDDDAYEMLRKYLNSVERKFSRDPGGSEVLQDMESRIAELFTEKLTNHREVVNVQDVREVLEVLGAPADMGGQEKEALIITTGIKDGIKECTVILRISQ